MKFHKINGDYYNLSDVVRIRGPFARGGIGVYYFDTSCGHALEIVATKEYDMPLYNTTDDIFEDEYQIACDYVIKTIKREAEEWFEKNIQPLINK